MEKLLTGILLLSTIINPLLFANENVFSKDLVGEYILNFPHHLKKEVRDYKETYITVKFDGEIMVNGSSRMRCSKLSKRQQDKVNKLLDREEIDKYDDEMAYSCKMDGLFQRKQIEFWTVNKNNDELTITRRNPFDRIRYSSWDKI